MSTYQRRQRADGLTKFLPGPLHRKAMEGLTLELLRTVEPSLNVTLCRILVTPEEGDANTGEHERRREIDEWSEYDIIENDRIEIVSKRSGSRGSSDSIRSRVSLDLDLSNASF